MLDNLLSNALKYTLHGEVRLHLAAPSEPGEPLTMAVIDTGIGISPERQAQVFQPYERVEDPRVAHVEGSGLGLTVVRLLCERLGLTLSLHSVPGEGTTVTLRWPA